MVLRLFSFGELFAQFSFFLTARIAHTRLTIKVVTKDSVSQGYCELYTSTLHNK